VSCKKSRLRFGLQHALTSYSSVGEPWTRRSLKSSLATYGRKRIFALCLLLMLPLCGWSQSYLGSAGAPHAE
jgi:hypothetical protein